MMLFLSCLCLMYDISPNFVNYFIFLRNGGNVILLKYQICFFQPFLGPHLHLEGLVFPTTFMHTEHK